MTAATYPVVVTGPAGCGKTFHADAIKRRLACDWIVDDWEPGDHRTIPDNALLLTTAPRDEIAQALPQASVHDFAIFGLPKPGAAA